MRTPLVLLIVIVVSATVHVGWFNGRRVWADNVKLGKKPAHGSLDSVMQVMAESPQICGIGVPLCNQPEKTTTPHENQRRGRARVKPGTASSRSLPAKKATLADLISGSQIRLTAGTSDETDAKGRGNVLRQPELRSPYLDPLAFNDTADQDEDDFLDDLPVPPEGDTADTEDMAPSETGSFGDYRREQLGHEATAPYPGYYGGGYFGPGADCYGPEHYYPGPYGAESYCPDSYGIGPYGAGSIGAVPHGPGQPHGGPERPCIAHGIWWEATAPQEIGLSAVVRQIELQPSGRYNEVVYHRSGIRVDVVIGSFLESHGELTLLVEGMPLAQNLARTIMVGGQPLTVAYHRGSSGPYAIAFNQDCSQMVLTDAGGVSRVWMRYPPPRFGVPIGARGYYAIGRPGYSTHHFPWLPNGTGDGFTVQPRGFQIPMSGIAPRQVPLRWYAR